MLVLSAAVVLSGCSSSRHDYAYSRTTAPPVYVAGGSTGAAQEEADTVISRGSALAPDEDVTAQNTQAANQFQPTVTGGTNMVIPLYQESVQVGKRTVDAGSVRVRKTVRSETVNQPVELRSERVEIDRLPAGEATEGLASSAQGAAAGQPFQEEEVVIRLQREEPVVEKRVVPAGNVIARVRPQTQQTTIESQVRREEVAVNTVGNPENVSVSPNLTINKTAEDWAVGASGDVSGQTQGTGASTGTVIQSLNTLTGARDLTTLAGRQVRLAEVQVQNTLGDRVIAIGAPGERPVYVRLQNPVQTLSPGDRVTLAGTIHRIPATLNAMGLGDAAVQVMQNQPIYIEADRVEIAR
jgi:uncharacterized protein (TIGR02271 family)